MGRYPGAGEGARPGPGPARSEAGYLLLLHLRRMLEGRSDQVQSGAQADQGLRPTRNALRPGTAAGIELARPGMIGQRIAAPPYFAGARVCTTFPVSSKNFRLGSPVAGTSSAMRRLPWASISCTE